MSGQSTLVNFETKPALSASTAVKSAITFIDGEKGILRYRGIPIEELDLGRRTPLPKQCARVQFTGTQSKVRGLVFAKIGKAAWQAV